jgi:hypothetical protein
MMRLGTRLAVILACAIAPAAASADEITLMISGVAASDMRPIQAELGGITGVSKVSVKTLKGGRATVAVEFDGTGGDLAVKLEDCVSGLKNVQEFDAATVTMVQRPPW